MPTIVPQFDPDTPGDIIDAIVDSFDFTLPGAGGESLGRDLVTRTAAGIAERSAQGLDPDGNPWRPNEPKRYAPYKLKRYGVDRPGELGGQMLSLESLTGRPEITPDRIVMSYGLGTPPRRTTARSGASLRPGELAATDTQKAEWFAEGDRRFYAFDDAIAETLVETAQKALDAYVTAATGGH